MNLTDLRDVLDERSTTDHAEARAHLMLTGVHERLRVRARRRRVASVAAAATAVLAVAAGTLAVTRPHNDPPAPVDGSARTVKGFAEYADGARVVAAESARPPADHVSVSFVPTTLKLAFLSRCADGEDESYRLLLNGRQMSVGDGCGQIIRSTPEALSKEYGLTVGKRASVTLTKTGTPIGELAVAVGVDVDPSRYPYPPRPAALTPLELPSVDRDDPHRLLVRSIPGRPELTITAAVRWPWTGELNLWSNTPGALTVKLNGVQVFHGQWWDYSAGQWGGPSAEQVQRLLRPTRGQPVQVTVTPERTTGDWAVVVGS